MLLMRLATFIKEILSSLDPTLWDLQETDPLVWYESSDLNNITSSGNNLTQINDRSGSNHAIASGTVNTGTTSLNNLNTLNFENGYITLTNQISPRAVVLVLTQIDTGYEEGVSNNVVNPVIGENLVSDDVEYTFLYINHTTFDISLDGGNTAGNNGTVTINGGVTSVNGSNLDLGVDFTSGPFILYIEFQNAAVTDWIGRFISPQTTGGYGANFELAEVAFWDNPLSSNDIDRVFGRLAHKWGLDNLLPTNHPYKNNAPITESIDLLDGLIAWWELNESSGNRTDSSSNSVVLTQVGGPISGGSAKISNGIILTENNAQWLSSSNSLLNLTGTQYWQCWVNLDSTFTVNNPVVFSKFRFDGADERQYVLRYNNSNSAFEFSVSSDGTSSTEVNVLSSSVSTNTAYFVEGYFDSINQQIGIAVDGGAFTVQATTFSSLHSSTAEFRLGAYDNPSVSQVRPWKGWIDELVFYDRLLNSAERAASYNSGNGTAYPTPSVNLLNGLISWWSMDEATGTRFDLSGNGYHLTPVSPVSSQSGIVNNATRVSGSGTTGAYLSSTNQGLISKISGDNIIYICYWAQRISSSSSLLIGIWNSSNDERVWHQYLRHHTDDVRFFGSADGANTAFTLISGTGTANENTWRFVEFYHDAENDEVGWALDGSAFTTQAFSGGLFGSLSPTTEFAVGKYSNSNTAQWNGDVDEMVIYNRIPSSEERAALYNSGNGTAFPDPYDSTTRAFINSLTGSYSKTRLDAINTFIVNLKAAGIWTKLDLVWLLCADNETDAAVDMTGNGFSFTNNGMSFLAAQGYQGDGASAYLLTDYDPSTDAINFSQNSASLGIYSRTDNTTDATDFGVRGPNYRTFIQTYDIPTRSTVTINQGGSDFLDDTPTSGFFLLTRTASNVARYYRNGVQVGGVINTVSTGIADSNFEIGVYNNNGSRQEFSDRRYALSFTGAGLDASEVTTLNTEVNNLLAAFVDEDAQDFINRLTGTYSQTELNAFDIFFAKLKSDGLYDTINALYIFALDSADDALLNLKGTDYTATRENSMTFTAREGFTGNGTNMYIDTNFNPTAASGNYTQNSGTLGVYCRNNIAENSFSIGSQTSSSSNRSYITPRWSDNVAYAIVNGDGGVNYVSPTVTTSAGFMAVSRTTSTAIASYQNGSLLDSGNFTSQAPANASFYIGAAHDLSNASGNSSSGETSNQLAAGVIASGWDATQHANFNTALEELLDVLGAGVV